MFRIVRKEKFTLEFQYIGSVPFWSFSFNPSSNRFLVHKSHSYDDVKSAKAAAAVWEAQYAAPGSGNSVKFFVVPAKNMTTLLYASHTGLRRLLDSENQICISSDDTGPWCLPAPRTVDNGEVRFEVPWDPSVEFLDALRELYTAEDGEFIVPQ